MYYSDSMSFLQVREVTVVVCLCFGEDARHFLTFCGMFLLGMYLSIAELIKGLNLLKIEAPC